MKINIVGSCAADICLIIPIQLITTSGFKSAIARVIVSKSSASTFSWILAKSSCENHLPSSILRTVASTSRFPRSESRVKSLCPSIPAAPRTRTLLVLIDNTFLFSHCSIYLYRLRLQYRLVEPFLCYAIISLCCLINQIIIGQGAPDSQFHYLRVFRRHQYAGFAVLTPFISASRPRLDGEGSPNHCFQERRREAI